ncbi:hypothetical protein KY360_03645 [Candidatus Woesearchaeota archaeon]|nr:hypothetical protein [Candidatus Woesearchaeota archaeon]
MPRLLLFRTLSKILGPIGLGATAFYLGTQNAHVASRVEHNLLRSHLEYAAESHRGSLAVEDVENDNGLLEKRLRNLDTGDFIYTVRTDCLPDNDFVYNGLTARVESSSPEELRDMHERARQLEGLVEARLYSGMPVNKESVNPLKLGVHVRSNVDGQLEAVLKYGDRAVILARDDFDYLARNGTQLAQEASLVPVQAATPGCQADVGQAPPSSGATTYLCLGVLGILAVASVAYKRAREKYPV